MTDREGMQREAVEASLELAYRAYRQNRPTDFEVTTAARRVHARLGQPGRRRLKRGPVLALALLLVGGAAFAAHLVEARSESAVGALKSNAEAPRSAQPAPKGDARSSQRVEPAPREQGMAQPTTAVDPLPTALPILSKPAQQPKASSKASRVPPAPAEPRGWREVAQAMRNEDHALAELALRELAASPDGHTRGNARLGLVQLAAGRGDCDQALVLLEELQQATIPSSVVRRGQRIVERCAEKARR